MKGVKIWMLMKVKWLLVVMLLVFLISTPSNSTTSVVTSKPSARPTRLVTLSPTRKPTLSPSRKPTRRPTATPTSRPSSRPSARPTSRPTSKPSSRPSFSPTRRPLPPPPPPGPNLFGKPSSYRHESTLFGSLFALSCLILGLGTFLYYTNEDFRHALHRVLPWSQPQSKNNKVDKVGKQSQAYTPVMNPMLDDTV